VLATRQYVDDKIIEVKNYVDDAMKKHLNNKDPHTQYATKASPVLTGTPEAPTAGAGDNSQQIATTAFVQSEAISAVSTATLPFPDVWAPLNDDLRLLAGFGPYDTLTIAGQTLELPTKSLNFQRASTATFIDKSGDLQTAATNEPRFEKQGLLIEGQSTNLCKYSDPGSSYWTRYGDVVVTGEDNGLARIVTKSDSYCGVYGAVPGLTPGNTYTLSCWLKGISGKNIRVMAEGANKSVIYSQAKDLPELTRISLTFVAVRAVETISLYAGFAGSEFIVGRVQVEEYSFPTSYIPTNGAAVTRAKDNVWLQEASNIPPGSDITISFCTGDVESDAAYGRLLDGQMTGFVFLRKDLINTGIRPYWAVQMNLPSLLSPPRNTPLTIRFDAEKVNIFSGDEKVSTVRTTSSALNKAGILALGASSVLSETMNSMGRMHIRNFRIWHSALSDNQIKGLR